MSQFGTPSSPLENKRLFCYYGFAFVALVFPLRKFEAARQPAVQPFLFYG